ncbi:hypothetical protein HDU80_003763, partial [Chytriomyces hyalinus]
ASKRQLVAEHENTMDAIHREYQEKLAAAQENYTKRLAQLEDSRLPMHTPVKAPIPSFRTVKECGICCDELEQYDQKIQMSYHRDARDRDREYGRDMRNNNTSNMKDGRDYRDSRDHRDHRDARDIRNGDRDRNADRNGDGRDRPARSDRDWREREPNERPEPKVVEIEKRASEVPEVEKDTVKRVPLSLEELLAKKEAAVVK